MQYPNDRLGNSLLMLVSGLFILATADAQTDLVRASGLSPFANCKVGPLTQTAVGEFNYLNSEVEPFVAVNSLHPQHIVGVWQQDRYSFGGARGLVTGVSHDGGTTWARTFPHFSICAGGKVSNGGNYERASDPWVTISPDGTVYQSALVFDAVRGVSKAVLVSRSTDNGDTWSEPTALIRDADANVDDDKETITADPRQSRFVYAVWDRLDYNGGYSGPVWFARTTNGGKSWERAHIIYNPGADSSTIGNQIVVLPDGTLVNIFTRFDMAAGGAVLAIIRSKDHGAHWSPPIVINTLESVGVVDVKNAELVRTGEVEPSIAVDRKRGAMYVVWQDARFSGGKRDGIVYAKSVNGGLTWSAPVQLNRVPAVQAFTASVDVTSNGVVAVNYYDFRNDTANPDVLLTDYWQVTSTNGGASWQERQRGPTFDMVTAPYADGYFVGDYEVLGHQDDTFLPFFAQANSGHLWNRTDVFAAVTAGAASLGNGHAEVNARPRGLRERVESHRERKPH